MHGPPQLATAFSSLTSTPYEYVLFPKVCLPTSISASKLSSKVTSFEKPSLMRPKEQVWVLSPRPMAPCAAT